MRSAAFALMLVIGILAGMRTAGAAAAPIVVVPLDDRPVTSRLPAMLGAIAGVPVVMPPRALLGNYLTPGDPDAIAAWLRSSATSGAGAFVLSADMLAYGGLVASRAPGISASGADLRLGRLSELRALRPGAAFYGFGTVMRLAPTGVPALGKAAAHFAAGDDVELLTQYANLPDPPVAPQDVAKAARLRARLGPVLDAYLATRRRDLDVDRYELELTAGSVFDRFILGQDDAGPQGLHLHDLAALQQERRRFGIVSRTSLEPGADELAMVLLASALAHQLDWTPAVHVTWSRPDGGALQDPIEFAPLENTLDGIVRASGARRVEGGAEIELFVRARGTTAAQERSFVDAVAAAVARGAIVSVADLTFLGGSVEEQHALVEELMARKLAGRLAGFASWNTAANSLGTALPAAIATGAGMRAGTFNRRALAEFLLDRYADDYAFHGFVRPQLIAGLERSGIDHDYILPAVAARVASENRRLLWPRALELLASIFPGYRDAGMTIVLPWDRTFETDLDIRLAG